MTPSEFKFRHEKKAEIVEKISYSRRVENKLTTTTTTKNTHLGFILFPLKLLGEKKSQHIPNV